MDEKSLTDLLANLIPGEDEDTTGQAAKELKDGEKSLLLAGLTSLAGQSGGPLQAAVGEFLGGRGELLQRASSSSSKKTAIENVEEFLTTKLNVSPTLAKLIAPLVVNLVPALGGETAKPRRRRKAKPKSESSSAKKPKKPSSAKPAAKPKPSSSSKPKPKKKPASSSSSAKTGKKESRPAAKPKKSTRAETVEDHLPSGE
jgi:outer membrane biosynthesis protein TonB